VIVWGLKKRHWTKRALRRTTRRDVLQKGKKLQCSTGGERPTENRPPQLDEKLRGEARELSRGSINLGEARGLPRREREEARRTPEIPVDKDYRGDTRGKDGLYSGIGGGDVGGEKGRSDHCLKPVRSKQLGEKNISLMKRDLGGEDTGGLQQ